jgi:ankyrin repeat protein
MEVLASGTVSDLEDLRQRIDGFPEGFDNIVDRHWITNAIDCGSRLAIEWMISKGVDLSFRDDEGFTVLHSAVDRQSPDRYEILDLLLTHGAPVNIRGIFETTAAHKAALLDDVDALRVLVKHGADLSLRDCDSTPLEGARMLHAERAVKFLEEIAREPRK